MYVTRTPRHPRCRASRLLSALDFPDSSSPRGGPLTDGCRRHCCTSPLPTPAHALRLLSSIPLHANGTTGSRITRSGRRRTEDRTLAGQPISCPTVVPLPRNGRPRPFGRRGLASRRRLRGSRCSRSTTLGTGVSLVLQRGTYARRATVRSRGGRAEGASEDSEDSEARHRGDTEQPFETGARHDDDYQRHPCRRRRPHQDARPGWDGVGRVRGACKGRARRRRLAGRNWG